MDFKNMFQFKYFKTNKFNNEDLQLENYRLKIYEQLFKERSTFQKETNNFSNIHITFYKILQIEFINIHLLKISQLLSLDKTTKHR